MKTVSDKLTDKQEKFCKLIVEGKGQYEAYVEAFGPRKGPRAHIDVDASQLRSTPKIDRRIAFLAKKVDEKFELRTADLLREAARVAFSDVRQLMTVDGKVKLPTELDADTAKAISSFKIDELGRIEYKFWDKNNAQERLFKFKGLFEKDHAQQSGGLMALRDALHGRVLGANPAAASFGDGEDDDVVDV